MDSSSSREPSSTKTSSPVSCGLVAQRDLAHLAVRRQRANTSPQRARGAARQAVIGTAGSAGPPKRRRTPGAVHPCGVSRACRASTCRRQARHHCRTRPRSADVRTAVGANVACRRAPEASVGEDESLHDKLCAASSALTKPQYCIAPVKTTAHVFQPGGSVDVRASGSGMRPS